MRILFALAVLLAAAAAFAGTARPPTTFGDCVGLLPAGDKYSLSIGVKVDHHSEASAL